MSAQSFRQHINQLMTLSDSCLFYKTSGKEISYPQFFKLTKEIITALQHEKEKKLIVKCQDPLFVFSVVLAAFFAGKKIFLVPGSLQEHQLSLYELNGLKCLTSLNDLAISESQKDSDLFASAFNETQPYLYFFSSGTTGKPKAIGHSIRTLTASAGSIVSVFKMQKGQTTYLNLPVHHVGGQMTLWRAFLSEGLIDLSGDHFDYASFVPLQIERMLDDAPQTEKLKKARAILIGGGILKEDLKTKLQELQIPFFETYGMTESASAVMLNGKPLPEQQIELENGKFKIKGPTLAPTVKLDADGFYRTNDCGEWKSDGHMVFTERSDLNFKSAGELINPLVIESVIKELSWIKEAVVTGLPDATWTQAATLLYQTNHLRMEDDTEKERNEISAHIKKFLPSYMVPKYFFRHQFAEEGIKPSRFLLLKKARQYQAQELINHDFIPARKEKQRLIVFLHGFMGTLSDLKECFAQSVQEHFPHTAQLYIDLPGHGKTKFAAVSTRVDALLKLSDLIEAYRSSDNEELLLYGYSMGGRLALDLSLRYLPVTKLIVESSSFGLSSPGEREERLTSDQTLISEPQFKQEAFLRKWYAAPLFYNYNSHPRFESDLKNKLPHDYREWQKAMALFSPGYDSLKSETIADLKMKALSVYMVTGSHDEKYRDHMQEIATELGLSLDFVTEAGHNPHRTHPIEMRAILLKILALK